MKNYTTKFKNYPEKEWNAYMKKFDDLEIVPGRECNRKIHELMVERKKFKLWKIDHIDFMFKNLKTSHCAYSAIKSIEWFEICERQLKTLKKFLIDNLKYTFERHQLAKENRDKNYYI